MTIAKTEQDAANDYEIRIRGSEQRIVSAAGSANGEPPSILQGQEYTRKFPDNEIDKLMPAKSRSATAHRSAKVIR